ncbi:hypothetical protein C4585_00500 [Candidatus Parcubacteria bacterium]|nr:MAG: hypothetical protein C4585_00500 [Candidatus Parcubacteria bacterium]
MYLYKHTTERLRLSLAIVVCALFVAMPLTILSQETEEVDAASDALPLSTITKPLPQELRSCFDFYTYGSISVIPEMDLVSTLPGATVAIRATIENTNPHPIIDGTVYVKIFKQRDAGSIRFGGDLVDQFEAIKDVALLPGETKQLTFEWKVPTNSDIGEYQVATYFLSANRFNLAGLTFTDDIVASTIGFKVGGEHEGSVRFDRESVTVNGEIHEFATFIPHVEGNESAVIKAMVSNTTDMPYKGELTWTLYGWDGMRSEAILDQQSTELKVHPDDVTEVQYVASSINRQYPVYYLVGELSNGESKSVIDVRYSHRREDTQWARFNDVGVSGSHPTGSGDVAYACFQSFTGVPDSEPTGMVRVQITEPGYLLGSKVVAQGEYQGILPYEFAALPVAIPEGLTNFTVSAALYVGDNLIDTVSMQYSCRELSPESCEGGINTLGLILLGGAGAIAIAVLLMYRARRNTSGGAATGMQNPINTMNV